MFYSKCNSKKLRMTQAWGGIVALSLFLLPLPGVFAEAPSAQSHVQKAGMNHQTPEWAERLKGQTIVENAHEGRAERSALVEKQHERLMEQM